MTDSLQLLSPTPGAPVTVNPATGKPPRWKMALDVDRCTGCHACSVACKVEHSVPLGRYRTKVYYWEQGKFPQVKRNFLPTLCMQCEDAPCLKSCKQEAISRRVDGIVRIDPDECDHSGDCEKACPYAAISCDNNDVANKPPCSSRKKKPGLRSSTRAAPRRWAMPSCRYSVAAGGHARRVRRSVFDTQGVISRIEKLL